MRAFILPTALATVVAASIAAPAQAELTDVRADRAGATGRVWLAFDEQPSSVSAIVTGRGVELTVGGVDVRDRRITPAHRDLIGSVMVSREEGGARIRLGASGAWESAEAQILQGGILVRVRLEDGGALTMAPIADPGPADTTSGETESSPIEATPDGATTETGTASGDPASSTDTSSSASGAEPGEAAMEENGSEAMPAETEPAAPATEDPSAAEALAAIPEPCRPAARAVQQNPWDDELLFAEAACLTDEEALDQAAVIYERMLAFEPENFRATIALADIRAEMGDAEAARELYNLAAQYALSDAEASRARARLRELRGN